jgi:ectoine hydroxylase-related dioxygenase (phytanoyl-CoA dioxygenase family)
MIESLPATASPSEIADMLKREGCVVVRSLANSRTCNLIRAELAPYLAAKEGEEPINSPYREVGEDFLPSKTRRVAGVIAKSPAYCALVTHPLVLAVCDSMLLPNCSNYQVCTTAVLVPDPEARAQALHREDLLWPNLPSPHPVLEVATMWAISDFTEENGATRLVPGSHLWWDDRTAREDETFAAEMPSGSVLLWLDHTLHAAGANNSNAPRFGATVIYNLGWLRQEENQYLAVPPEVARTLPEDLQKLVGYQLHGPGLGFSGDIGKDPIELLRA